MVALIVIHNCAVLGLFALENITMAEMFGCKNRFTRMAISKEIGGLIASGFGPILAGIFCTMTKSCVSDRHYDHGIFSDWFNLCAENARSERP